jgi:hypothetical protein
VKSIVDCRRIASVSISYAGVSTTTDTNGNFTLKVPVSRKYSSATLTAQRNGWGKVQPSVTAQAGATNNLVIFMSTSGRIVGRVTNASGAGVAGASVKLTGGKLVTSKTISTDSAGSYASGWIPVGSYAVSVSASGFASKSSSTTVSTGLISTVNLNLQ